MSQKPTPLWKALLLEHRLPTRHKQKLHKIVIFPSMLKQCISAHKQHNELIKNLKHSNKPKVLLDSSLKIYGSRYIFLLSRIFQIAGYDVSVLLETRHGLFYPLTKKIKCFYDVEGIDKQIFTEPINLTYELPEDTENYIYFTEEKKDWHLDKKWKSVIGIDLENQNPYFNPKIKKHLHVYPSDNKKYRHAMVNLFFYPSLCTTNNFNKVKKLRKSKRKFTFAFFGNYTISCYLKRKIANLQCRSEIIKKIKDNLNNLVIIKSEKQLKRPIKNKFLLAHEEFRSKQEHWLDILSETDFFLCPSGGMILCHNLVESMAVGAIPVTDHPDYYSPKLQHMKNCIVFNEKNMLKVLNQVLNMKQSQIKKLRKNVINYYENYLEPNNWVKYILQL